MPTERLSDVLLAEATRQIGTFLAHQLWNVPLSHVFVANLLGISWVDSPPTFRELPLSASALAVLAERRTGRGASGGLELTVTFARNGMPFATGVGSMQCVSEQVYRRLRSGHAPAVSSDLPVPETMGMPPTAVGRRRQEQVVIECLHRSSGQAGAGGTTYARLRVDPAQPLFFDHPYDHIPGTLILEAASQLAASALPGTELRSLVGTFDRYLELGREVTFRGNVRGVNGYEIQVEQDGASAARVEVGLFTDRPADEASAECSPYCASS